MSRVYFSIRLICAILVMDMLFRYLDNENFVLKIITIFAPGIVSRYQNENSEINKMIFEVNTNKYCCSKMSNSMENSEKLVRYSLSIDKIQNININKLTEGELFVIIQYIEKVKCFNENRNNFTNVDLNDLSNLSLEVIKILNALLKRHI